MSIAAPSNLSLTFLLLLQTITQASQSSIADRISEAVRSAGYNTMSTVLLNNQTLLQTSSSHNQAISIFAPRDEALDDMYSPVELEHQIVPFKVDAHFLQHSCLADTDQSSCVLELPTLDKKRKLLVTGSLGREDERYNIVYVNSVKIVQWNVYNDAHVVVHGVQTLFPHRGDDWD